MNKLFACCLLMVCWLTAKADHITGGEMYYYFTGVSGGQYQYRVTAKLFMRCNSGRQFNNPNTISVFDKATGSRIRDITVPLARQENLSLTNPNKCITNPPTVCYVVGYYDFDLSLPASAGGYILTIQVNFRINGITNMGTYNNVGATYTAEIPGTDTGPAAPQNNSAQFTGSDLVVVCANNSFAYSFAAQDNDGDELRYSFCYAYVTNTSGPNAAPPGSPPYQSVPYGAGFNGGAPLGGNVHVDSRTGLITGIAPDNGIYVVTVCVEEIRNGVVIATQRKDVQINIASCTIAAASLLPEYQLCRNTTTLSLSNLSASPLINTYNWELANSAGTTVFSSSAATVSYTFPDTGLYRIKLVINKNQECSDSTFSQARVYPGFIPSFDTKGICFSKPTTFTDATTSLYGQVRSWVWDFGENTTSGDVSNQRNPGYTYPAMGSKNVQLIVADTKGCMDTVSKNITIIDKPPITLAFRDTLMCNKDKVQLQAKAEGQFSWSPNAAITAANTATPTVGPQTTTTYIVDVNDNGCLNRDSVRVRVTDKVNLLAMNDTTICQGDAIRLRAASDGFTYLWTATPSAQLSNPKILNPVAVSNATTTFQITAAIGSCTASDQVVVTAVPYPVANAGNDTTLCYHTAAQLNGHTDGSSVVWSPAGSLSRPDVLNPVATPAATTAYVLSAFDTKGCPRPGRDTVIVAVLPDINAFAGRDTAVIIGQSLQLQASGGTAYNWIPSTGLSATNIANPLAAFTSPEDVQYKVLVYNLGGCADSDYINVNVFLTGPWVFVPTAFTPNGDGKNDRLKPIAVGIKSVLYFHVFNRWGQLVYSGGLNEWGWDGTIGGKEQGTNTYVWEVKAIDYTGKPLMQKGMVTLIR
jgi:gliding motility-associated-like protein